jgi:hypothetical protein
MGMDSMMAVELKTRLERALGVSLRVTSLFDCPNVRSLAKSLMAGPADDGNAGLEAKLGRLEELLEAVGA